MWGSKVQTWKARMSLLLLFVLGLTGLSYCRQESSTPGKAEENKKEGDEKQEKALLREGEDGKTGQEDREGTPCQLEEERHFFEDGKTGREYREGKGSQIADEYVSLRKEMVQSQIVARGVKDARVIEAMLKVPRHCFVPQGMVSYAYADSALPIEHKQTISQPYIVAFMTEALRLKGNEKVLEIGTGSGYQAAILAELASEVYTIEIVEPLAKSAEKLLSEMGYTNVSVKAGDGYQGWKEHAPFDAIIVTCAPDHIPLPLQEQLKVGGRMIIPVGDWAQELIYIEKVAPGKCIQKAILPVMFVPMTGEAEGK